jgi:transcriptional regulator with XRE-family HTH domain
MSLQSRIRMARRRAGMSQAALAQAVGVQRSAVSHWEAPKGKNPRVAHLRAVASTTATQFEWLATGRGPMVLSEDLEQYSVAAADAVLIDDPVEMRLLAAFRDAPGRARTALVELAEELASQRIGRNRTTRPT